MIKLLKEIVTIKSRNKKLHDFYQLYSQGETVLDVGVSNEVARKVPATTNYFLKTIQFSDDLYTGLSIECTTGMNLKFPGKRFVEYPGDLFPFKDNEFDWLFCNAVIEHVGDVSKQILFFNEMIRVAKNVFLTTPNKFFPMESHTNILLLHWFDRLFYSYCAAKNPYWSSRDHLNLLSYKDLEKICISSNAKKYKIIKNRFLLYPMTFSVVASLD